MLDSRLKKLANMLVNYSCELKKNEKILIEATDVDPNFVVEIVNEVYKVGGVPFVKLYDNRINRALNMHTDASREKLRCSFDRPQMEQMDAYISIKSGNKFELSDVPKQNLADISTYYSYPVHHETRVSKTKWVILIFPTALYAQNAQMSTQAFEDFYCKVCTLDYKKMGEAMDPLVKLMEQTDKVRIVAEGTNLQFSIKGMPAIKCAGKCNIPDGEVYTAPIKNSVNGTIRYNIPVMSPNGVRHDFITLTFENGKIIKAVSNSEEDVNIVFDTDDGARYVGEFSLGINPYIEKPMLDILYDEKIKGSIHFTPGCCYDECDNGNKSALHWDLIQCHTPEYGGGEIYFDDVLIRKDGRFVVKELLGLNPENLV